MRLGRCSKCGVPRCMCAGVAGTLPPRYGDAVEGGQSARKPKESTEPRRMTRTERLRASAREVRAHGHTASELCPCARITRFPAVRPSPPPCCGRRWHWLRPRMRSRFDARAAAPRNRKLLGRQPRWPLPEKIPTSRGLRAHWGHDATTKKARPAPAPCSPRQPPPQPCHRLWTIFSDQQPQPPLKALHQRPRSPSQWSSTPAGPACQSRRVRALLGKMRRTGRC